MTTTNPRLIPTWRELTAIGPHNDAHRVAIRAAISMAVPMLVLLAIGQMRLAPYATFGAFTCLYGREKPHLVRVRMQAFGGLFIILGVVFGTMVATSGARDWLIVPIAACYAAMVGLAARAARWHPPGPLFAVFAIAGCAAIPVGPGRIPVAFLVACGSASFALLIGVAGYLRPAARADGAASDGVAFKIDFRAAWSDPAARETQLRYLIAVSIAGAIPTALGLNHPYWSMVAAVVATSGPHPKSRMVRGIQRLAGTTIGVGIAAAIIALHPTDFETILIMACLQGTAELVIGRNYGLALMFITPLALVMVALGHPATAQSLPLQRLLETVIGAIVGMLVTASFFGWHSRREQG